MQVVQELLLQVLRRVLTVKMSPYYQCVGEKRPHAVDVGGELRGGGRGELEELARLVVREALTWGARVWPMA